MSDGAIASRRDFLKTSVQVGGGLLLGFALPAAGRWSALAAPTVDHAAAMAHPINAFVRVDTDNTITLLMHKSEMGQGVYTGLVQLLAEELECDPTLVRIETAPVDAAYNNPFLPAQFTGGSMSISSSWQGLRMAGATARTALVNAAAAQWQVAATACRAENAVVLGPNGQHATFGQLAAAAAQLPAPDPKSITLKPASEFKVIGKSLHRVESAEKINGSGKFGLDVRLPGMLRAVIARAPTYGATLKSFDDKAALAVRGVIKVVAISAGVAVIAKNTFAARKGRDALVIDWVAGPAAAWDSERQRAEYLKLAATPAAIAHTQGDVVAGMKEAAIRLDAYYELPYLAHAPMEPLNCVADWRRDRCDVWTGTQMQSIDRAAAAGLAGLAPEQVHIHTMLLGGGFGRRANTTSDFVREAVELSRKLEKPVQIVWTREDDMRGGWYRPMWADRIQVGLNKQGLPTAWQHTLVGQSILKGTSFEKFMVHAGIDSTSVEGASDIPYTVPNIRVDLHTTDAPVTVLWWRSVGHSHTAFVVESTIDECASAAGMSPFEYRRSLLDVKQTRHRAVLDLLEEKSGWKQPLAAGRARGVALHESFGSVVGEVAEVSMQDGLPKIHRVTAVIHCGFAVNPQLVKSQLESAITFGLSAALFGEITFKEGVVQQSNFDTYPVVRMNEAPMVDAFIVPSDAAPTGVGEPGVPPLAPAVANALFSLTHKRIRHLPLVRGGQFTA